MLYMISGLLYSHILCNGGKMKIVKSRSIIEVIVLCIASYVLGSFLFWLSSNTQNDAFLVFTLPLSFYTKESIIKMSGIVVISIYQVFKLANKGIDEQNKQFYRKYIYSLYIFTFLSVFGLIFGLQGKIDDEFNFVKSYFNTLLGFPAYSILLLGIIPHLISKGFKCSFNIDKSNIKHLIVMLTYYCLAVVLLFNVIEYNIKWSFVVMITLGGYVIKVFFDMLFAFSKAKQGA